MGLAATAALVVGLTAGCSGQEDEATRAARAFLAAWAAGDAEKAASLTDAPDRAKEELARINGENGDSGGSGELGVSKARLTPGTKQDGPREGVARVPFRAELTFIGGGTWRYRSSAEVRKSAGGEWKVHFTPAVIHPRLKEPTSRLMLYRELPARAGILAADGSNLAPETTVWAVSVWPTKVKDPERLYRALEDPELGVDIDTKALKSRVEAAKPDQAVPVVTLRDEVFRKVRHNLMAARGLQFHDVERAVATTAKPLIGSVQPATAETLKNAGPYAAAADAVGASGLQYRYQKQLAGTPDITVRAAGTPAYGDGRVVYRSKGKPGRPVRTTLDPTAQRAADAALANTVEEDEKDEKEGRKEQKAKSAALVAVRPSTGEILAAANAPDSTENRAFNGRYPPGSTFKVVTAAALLRSGVAPKTPVPCPRTATVNGQRFQNQDEFDLPTGTTLREAFARSCNTAFIGLRDRLRQGALTDAAGRFGIGGTWDVGAATFDGRVPTDTSDNDKAAAVIGQGRVETSPLAMASVAATVKAGSFKQPVLVPGAVQKKHRPDKKLDAGVVRQLRTLMRAVVSEGSGSALRGISGSPGAKTGTAEFGTGNPPRTHAWMIGFRGDLAFAVFLEDGGSGGKDAGPVAAKFLRELD
ncbi:penicillin-binding transpeptidase domain-containing protein [Streptomyces sp. NPDC050315]|uniref:penicillin-binding transpeptidase domain-containing protein n=1 Tax=Streptomyces sp. NPDC050315 TaxID=3155039 RepID=UPI00343A9C1C